MKRALTWLLFGVLLAALLAGACRNQDEEQTTDGNSPTPPAGGCDDNTAPTISGATVFVNGAAVGDDPSFMVTDAAELYLAFTDAECNLGGGRVEYSLDALPATSSRTLPADLPCDGSAADKLVGFAMPAADVGAYVLLVNLSDRCGTRSQTQSVAFTVSPYEPPADDDTSPGDDDTTPSTSLGGTISYVGDATDLEARPVYLGLFTQWLPDGTWPTAWTQLDVPHEGLPFAYEWDLTGTTVVTGDYYLFAFLDLVDGDGLIHPAVDPVHAPYLPTSITEGEATTANLTLISPTK